MRKSFDSKEEKILKATNVMGLYQRSYLKEVSD